MRKNKKRIIKINDFLEIPKEVYGKDTKLTIVRI